MATDAEILAAVKTAIYNLVSGEVASVTMPNGRAYTLQDLDKLQRLEQYYSGKTAYSSSAGRQRIVLGDISGGEGG